MALDRRQVFRVVAGAAIAAAAASGTRLPTGLKEAIAPGGSYKDLVITWNRTTKTLSVGGSGPMATFTSLAEAVNKMWEMEEMLGEAPIKTTTDGGLAIEPGISMELGSRLDPTKTLLPLIPGISYRVET